MVAAILALSLAWPCGACHIAAPDCRVVHHAPHYAALRDALPDPDYAVSYDAVPEFPYTVCCDATPSLTHAARCDAVSDLTYAISYDAAPSGPDRFGSSAPSRKFGPAPGFSIGWLFEPVATPEGRAMRSRFRRTRAGSKLAEGAVPSQP